MKVKTKLRGLQYVASAVAIVAMVAAGLYVSGGAVLAAMITFAAGLIAGTAIALRISDPGDS